MLGEEEGKEVQRQEEEEEAEAAEAAEVRRTGGGKRNIKIEGQQCGPPSYKLVYKPH